MTRRDKLVERIRRRPVSARFSDVRSLLEDYGWTYDRMNGSHAAFTKPGESTLSIPVHNKEVKHFYVGRICDLLDLDSGNETD